MWTFESRMKGLTQWEQSSQKTDSLKMICSAMSRWVEANAENDVIVEVRLKKID